VTGGPYVNNQRAGQSRQITTFGRVASYRFITGLPALEGCPDGLHHAIEQYQHEDPAFPLTPEYLPGGVTAVLPGRERLVECGPGRACRAGSPPPRRAALRPIVRKPPSGMSVWAAMRVPVTNPAMRRDSAPLGAAEWSDARELST
jgi:hypothetical protein